MTAVSGGDVPVHSSRLRIARIAAVTAGLVATGAAVGAVLGVLVTVTLLGSAGGGLALLLNIDSVLFIGAYGAAMGAVLGPLAAWLLMRHVPLWKAIGGTALGTLAGSLLGLVGDGEMGFAGAFLGFGAAAFLMWLENAWKTRNDTLDCRDLPRV
ncbi:MAG: hypothetical protein ABW277_17700 [Longimicrobiaceae bacterium]